MPSIKELPAHQRFWPKVDKRGPIPEERPELGPCWLWMNGTTGDGYGAFTDDGYVLAHRWAYTSLRGVIPDGLHLDHLCKNPPCVNPAHLEAVPCRTNLMRSSMAPAAINAGKTECIHGHEFTPENTRIRRGGARECKECRRETTRRYRARRRARLMGG